MEKLNIKLKSVLLFAVTSVVLAQKPNIVFMLADDLGYGDLATYGHPYAKTPNLDQLAKDGTQFMNFYVSGNTCNPSRTGFMTSRHPNSYANNTIQHGFQDRIAITEILRNNGYRVGHFGKWHIGPDESNGTYGIHHIKIMGSPNKDPEGRDMGVFKEAAKWIEANKDVPFYVNVWGHATHYAVDPAVSLANIFKDVEVDRDLFGVNMQATFDDVEGLGGDIDVGMRNYLGDVYGLDSAVGHLLDKIDELNLREKTIVIFSSDQGPAPVNVKEHASDDRSKNMVGWAGKLKGGKHNNWEGGVRAPFIIRWPGEIPAGKINENSLFSAMDFLPTLAGIGGANINTDMFEGENVTDIWKGANRSRANPLFWKWAGLTVVQGSWKLTYQNGKAELFDLSKDAEELNDVSGKHPNITSELDKLIKGWTASIPKAVNHDKNTFLDDPVKEAVVIGPANVPIHGGRGKDNTPNSNISIIINSSFDILRVTIADKSVSDYKVSIFNSNGKKIVEEEVTGPKDHLSTKGWKSGIYHVMITTKGMDKVKKFFIP